MPRPRLEPDQTAGHIHLTLPASLLEEFRRLVPPKQRSGVVAAWMRRYVRRARADRDGED